MISMNAWIHALSLIIEVMGGNGLGITRYWGQKNCRKIRQNYLQ